MIKILEVFLSFHYNHTYHICLPRDSRILDVQMINLQEIRLWALGDDKNPSEFRKFVVVQSDKNFEDAWMFDYINTVVDFNSIAWHVFELKSVYDQTRNQVQGQS